MGDPRLLQISEAVSDLHAPWVSQLVADLLDTMRAAEGAGLAAPQIGVAARVVIFGGGVSLRYPDAPAIPQTVLINPKLKPLGDELEDGWEGCLSVPGLRGWVPRFARLRYQGFDERGHIIDRTVEGFHARVVQHEVDHLDGVLYPMRIRDLTKFGFHAELFPGETDSDD